MISRPFPINMTKTKFLLNTADPSGPNYHYLLFLLLLFLLVMVTFAHAGPRIPGVDASNQLEAAGTVLRIVDTALFKWGGKAFFRYQYFICWIQPQGTKVWGGYHLYYCRHHSGNSPSLGGKYLLHWWRRGNFQVGVSI